MSIQCGGFTFISNFDSGNIARVELVPQEESGEPAQDKSVPHCEFNIWTKPDCADTEFENNNKSWFHFGVTGGTPCTDVKLNVVNLNKQGKLYKQGMAPVFKTIPGSNRWERVRECLSFDLKKNLLSFGYRTLENLCSTTYFAFTYPYSFVDLQNSFKQHDSILKKMNICSNPMEADLDDIYYHRECVIMSLESRPIDLITISSHHGIMNEREPRLRDLFPDKDTERPHLFKGKKVIFLSARVHPGETPSSFVMNGVLSSLLNKTDPVAMILRKTFVFKLIPMLNPDGVSKGFYRTDTRGVNLNRLYLNPSFVLHPSVFAARALILYYHFGDEIADETLDNLQSESAEEPKSFEISYFSSCTNSPTDAVPNDSSVRKESSELLPDAASASSSTIVAESTPSQEDSDIRILSDTDNLNDKVAEISMAEENNAIARQTSLETVVPSISISSSLPNLPSLSPSIENSSIRKKFIKTRRLSRSDIEGNKRQTDSGLYLYVDFHGHASKKGIFMYGNHFDNINDRVDCMLLPKLLSINNPNFHYNQCNFSKRNMYTRESMVDVHYIDSEISLFVSKTGMEHPHIMTKTLELGVILCRNFKKTPETILDRRDGLSREGSGRVAVLKYTGLIKSYTLECNYNTGCIVNIIPPTPRPLGKHIVHPVLVPPKYTPQIYEEVGRALCVSILDLIGCNPNSRLQLSQYKTVNGLKESLRSEALLAKSLQNQPTMKMRQSIAVMQRGSKPMNKNYAAKNRKFLSLKRQSCQSASADRKESSLGVVSLATSSNATNILHPLNKCGILSNTAITSLMKKQNPVGKLSSKPKKKNIPLRKKKTVFEASYKLEKEKLPNRGEFSGWSTIKRKIEKKSSPSGNANTSARPPNKKRRKSKIL